MSAGYWVNVDSHGNARVLRMSRARFGLLVVTLLMQAVTWGSQ